MTKAVSSDPSGILVFCRPYLVDDFKANFAALPRGEKLFFLTDGRKKGTNDTREAFYRHLRSGRPPALLDADQSDDCIRRCRLLRNLDRDDAERRLHAMAATLQEWLDRLNPEGVICHWVDEYVTHLLSILARRRGIGFVGYAHSLFPGLLQLTSSANGDAFDIRIPSSNEVEKAIGAVVKPFFRQDYNQRLNYSLRRHVLGIGRYYVKRIVFLAKGYLERDPLHVHYAITPYLAERRRIRDFPSANCFSNDWQSELTSLQKKSSSPTVFVPLAYFPEAAIDYWIKDKSIIDYENKTVEIVAALSGDCVVAIKEHPHMLGARNAVFYERLKSVPNVVMVPPLEYSAEVMARSDAVLLGAGSVGIEAALRDKPIFTFSNTSYWFARSGAVYLDLASIDNWAETIVVALRSARTLSETEKHDFISACLASSVFPRSGGRRWPLIDPQHLAMLLEAVRKMPVSPRPVGGVECSRTG
ncbi:hypothetical protein ABID65_008694 [Bradyrhizobium sp. S3.9.2]|uniref:hypothetical protein n=1 Tax=Bradyrhizobium sp. S3.9.2 TaxID=3156432 RepID=UPI003392DE65